MTGSQRGPYTAIAVGVPARDEQDRIAAGLAALSRAARKVAVDVHVVVAADRCRDRTAAAVDAFAGSAHHLRSVSVVAGDWATVGDARHHACHLALDRTETSSAARAPATGTTRRLWLATTDADSRVSSEWFVVQLAHAHLGLAGVAGLVDLDPRETPFELDEQFRLDRRSFGAGHDHPHVHGANLAVDAGWYRAVGGFASLAVGEDVDMWHRLRAAGAPLRGVGDLRVTTSSRLHGRTRGGFSRYLRELSPLPAGTPATAPATVGGLPRLPSGYVGTTTTTPGRIERGAVGEDLRVMAKKLKKGDRVRVELSWRHDDGEGLRSGQGRPQAHVDHQGERATWPRPPRTIRSTWSRPQRGKRAAHKPSALSEMSKKQWKKANKQDKKDGAKAKASEKDDSKKSTKGRSGGSKSADDDERDELYRGFRAGGEHGAEGDRAVAGDRRIQVGGARRRRAAANRQGTGRDVGS